MRQRFALLSLLMLLAGRLWAAAPPLRLVPKASIAAGNAHTLAVQADGTLWAWGLNDHGQLGTGSSGAGTNPSPVQVGTGYVQAAAGEVHSVGLKADGSLYTWGRNDRGQLGLPSVTASVNVPTRVGADNDWVQIASSASHVLALKADGRLFAWGANAEGQVGINSTAFMVSAPTLVGTGFTQIAAGQAHSVALKADGTLWIWGGTKALGHLGNIIMAPIQVGASTNWTQISAGNGDHSLALKGDGTLWALGSNDHGQLGDGTSTPRSQPVQVVVGQPADAVNRNWVRLGAGGMHSLAVQADGGLFAWGYNTDGRLGLNTSGGAVLTPTLVGSGYVQAAPGSHSLAMKADGSVWAWGGANVHGQLGYANTAPGPFLYTAPRQTTLRAPRGHTQVAAGEVQSFALHSNGLLYAWGAFGKTGDPNPTVGNRLSPVLVGAGYVQVATSISFSLAIKADGTLWAWGEGGDGRLGTGNTNESRVPVQAAVGTPNNWVQVAAGTAHGLGLRADGTLWAWGFGFYGQLGNGTVSGSLVPVRVSGSDYVQVAAAGNNSVALKADGSLWQWGLGNATPARITTDQDWVQVAAGANHALALKADGTLWAWGINHEGQFGNNSISPSNIPVRTLGTGYTQVSTGPFHVLGLRSGGALFSWGGHWDGRLGDGGAAAGFQLSPTREAGAGLYRAVAAGEKHSLAIGADGRVYSTGYNAFGQLGNSSYTSRNTFSLVNDVPTAVRPISRAARTGLHLFPNPASGRVRVAGARLGQRLLLLNAHGQQVRQQPNADNTLDLQGLAPGLYLLSVEGGPSARLLVQ